MCALLLSLTLVSVLPLSGIAAAEPTFRGTVTDEQGRPQPDVLVVATGLANRSSGHWLTRTNLQGQFEFKEKLPSEQPLFFHVLKHGSYADAILPIPAATPPPMAFILKPAQTCTVSILDADGKPCPTAKIVSLSYAISPAQSVNLTDLGPDFVFPANEEGKVVIDILPPGDVRLLVAVETPASGRQGFVLAARGDDLSVRLKPVGSLAGRLIAPDGLSAAGIALRVVSSDPQARGEGAISVTVVTDAEGKFVVPKLIAGRALIQTQIDPARPVRLPTSREQPPPTVAIEEGKESQIEVTLHKAVRVTGSVLSRDDNQPIAGAKVVPWDNFRQQVQPEAITDKEGRYSLFYDSPNVRVRVEDAPPPFYTSVGTRLMQGARPGAAFDDIELPPMYLSRGIDRKGTVVEENGRPVPDAWVTATWPEANDGLFGRGPARTSMSSRTTRSNAQGRFTLERVSASADLLVRAATDDRASIVFTAAAAGDNGLIRLTVVPDAIIPLAGRVMNREGNPIAGATIEINELDGWAAGTKRPTYDLKREWKLTTDAAGHYETRLPAHIDASGAAGGSTRYTVYARSPTGAGTGHFVQVGGVDAQIDVPDFVLPPMRPGK